MHMRQNQDAKQIRVYIHTYMGIYAIYNQAEEKKGSLFTDTDKYKKKRRKQHYVGDECDCVPCSVRAVCMYMVLYMACDISFC